MVDVVVQGQGGIVTRGELLRAGMSPGRIRTQLRAGRWQALGVGVYATFTGPLPPTSRVWAAVLRSGLGAAAGPATTLWLLGVVDGEPRPLDVVVPAGRRVRGVPELVVIRRRGLADLVHPAALPPRLRVEQAVLDVAAVARRDEDAVDVLVRAVQRRLTTAPRIADRLAERSRHPRRRLVRDLLADLEPGVRSTLELRWLRTVERPHALPSAIFNRPDHDGRSRRYRDAEYLPWCLVVELDGREAHPDDERFRDRRRDNLVTVSGRRTLRYGWHEVVADPCGIAAEVGGVLRALGWPGAPRPCGPHCGCA